MTAEKSRLEEHRLQKANWKNWGPYLSERAWGSVREDYSPQGNPWQYFPHEHARSRTYRWNEDGLAGISDRNQYLCFSLALWNGNDRILKERLYGLSGPQGNHGEDVKEYYYYLDNLPTHSYMKMLYKYPQRKFPYAELISESMRRGYHDKEYELVETGVFEEDRYFDVTIEYAKVAQEDIVIRIQIENCGPADAVCHVLPQLWFRNTWSWGYPDGPMNDVRGKPMMQQIPANYGNSALEAKHPVLGSYYFYAKEAHELIFTDNETNHYLLYGTPNSGPYVKDGFHRYIVNREKGAVNPDKFGTKAGAYYPWIIPAHGKKTIELRLSKESLNDPFTNFDAAFEKRKNEADEFYTEIANPDLSEDEKKIQRQAFAGLLWSKQLYYFDVEQWFKGDPAYPPPPEGRREIRNQGWEHLVNFDIISMPDKWEYPWYATWDLGFHCLAFVIIDPDFAKRQLTLLTREWYMHPNGQFPAYEWDFNDVNPPVHAWAVWRVYKIDAKETGKPDRAFLEGMFHKLVLNFTWWVNRKDADGYNIFQGGFLGMDNISLFDRSKPLPSGGRIDQSDGTAWMAFYCIQLMKMALELAVEDPVYQDSATKFFEHFQRIAHAMQQCGKMKNSLWDEEDGFFYDLLHLPDGTIQYLKVRSLVGLLPLFAVETLDLELLSKNPIFERRVKWFIDRHTKDYSMMANIQGFGVGDRHLMAIMSEEKLRSVLSYMLDEEEFLSDYGIRSLSKYYEKHPYTFSIDGNEYEVKYQAAESETSLFGGNSNWRGPIWLPMNYLIIEALQKYHHYYGDDFKVEFPTRSGNHLTLNEVASEISKRLIRIFLKDDTGKRPVFGNHPLWQQDPRWKNNLLFFEYFNPETGEGLGASHQTGWTGLIAKLLQNPLNCLKTTRKN